MGQFLLAGDIGATKSNLVLVSADGGAPRVIAEATLPSREHASLPALVAELMRGAPGRVTAASFSVAGPVVEGRAVFPNLGWTVEREELRRALGVEAVSLVNDLQATACAVPHLAAEQVLTLQVGEPHSAGLKGVIAPGTGLGEALLIPDGAGGYDPLPTEGGHTDFAPTTAEQMELLSFLFARLGRVSYENVCSGNGIANIHRFLVETGRASDSAETAALVARAADPTPHIVAAGLRPADPGSASARALTLFTTILAAEAGNLALHGLTTGGVYIGGGLPPRMAHLLTEEAVLCAFRCKGPMSDLVRSIPLYLIMEPRTALWGAVHYGLTMVAGRRPAIRGGVPAGSG